MVGLAVFGLAIVSVYIFWNAIFEDLYRFIAVVYRSCSTL